MARVAVLPTTVAEVATILTTVGHWKTSQTVTPTTWATLRAEGIRQGTWKAADVPGESAPLAAGIESLNVLGLLG